MAGGNQLYGTCTVPCSRTERRYFDGRIAVTSTGDSANFKEVAIARMVPSRMGYRFKPVPSQQDIDLTQSPIMVPKDGSVLLQVWGKLASVQSSSSVSGATTGVFSLGNTMDAVSLPTSPRVNGIPATTIS